MSAILKPSPNESSRMMHDEFQRRRQARLLQVREQEKMVALRIRRAIQERHKREMENLSAVIHKEWKQNHDKKLKASEEKFQAGLKDVGSAHKEAETNATNQAMTSAIIEGMRKVARKRGVDAIQHQKNSQFQSERELNRMRKQKHIALMKEKLRARHIASLPTPQIDPTDTFVDVTMRSKSGSFDSLSNPFGQRQRFTTIQISDHESTMPTTVSLGLPSDAIVERATAEEAAVDANQAAAEEEERINLLQMEKNQGIQERMEKAKVRHEAALNRVRVAMDKKELMSDLREMQRQDGLRRHYLIDYPKKSDELKYKSGMEIFGEVASRFTENELRSTGNYTAEQEHDDDDIEEISEDSIPLFTVPERYSPEKHQTRNNALTKLLKQIEFQRIQKQRSQEASGITETSLSSVPSNLNSISSIEKEKTTTLASSTEDSLDNDKTTIEESTLEESTVPKRIGKPFSEKKPRLEPHSENNQVAADKFHTGTSTNAPATDEDTGNLEIALERSLESIKNNGALLKSVKDFQKRIIEQHRSYAQVQQQIKLLEEKKANLDFIITDITKPKQL